ncbi:recombinase family protein [Arthrobacter sp. 7Tela_A1]|uniref:recombinase family protein n=1 Tax=Arthrobacter sp. 7Tela_A1 TaxID=3093745 RepID=UPI003BB62DA7
MTTVNDLVHRGVEVRSLSDGIDPSTREGRLMLNLMATFAEYEANSSRNASRPASMLLRPRHQIPVRHRKPKRLR